MSGSTRRSSRDGRLLHDLAYALGDDAFDVEASEARVGTRSSAEDAPPRRLRASPRLPARNDEPRPRAAHGGAHCETPSRVRAPSSTPTCLPLNGNVGARRSSTHARREAPDGLPGQPPAGRPRARRRDRDWPQQQACTSMLGSIRLAGLFLRREPAMSTGALRHRGSVSPTARVYEQAYNSFRRRRRPCSSAANPGLPRARAATRSPTARWRAPATMKPWASISATRIG